MCFIFSEAEFAATLLLKGTVSIYTLIANPTFPLTIEYIVRVTYINLYKIIYMYYIRLDIIVKRELLKYVFKLFVQVFLI